MNKIDLDVFIFVCIFLFLINTYIYLFHSNKERFWKRMKRGLKKVGNVVGKYTGVTYVANKTGLSKQVNKKKCREERERARRDKDNESRYLNNTLTVKNSIDNLKDDVDTSLSVNSNNINAYIDKKIEAKTNTVFDQLSEDAVSQQILYQLDLTHDKKMDQIEELL